MRRIRLQFLYCVLIGLFLLALSVQAVWAQADGPVFPEPPPEGSFIIDLAEMVTAPDEVTINGEANQLWQDEGIPIFVLTIPSLADQDAPDYSIERYAAALFSIWGIGSEEDNRGILLLVSRDDREARIELGADWDRGYDAEAQKIMDNAIIPQFRADAYSTGILNGVERLTALSSLTPTPTRRPSSSTRTEVPRTVSPSAEPRSSFGSGCNGVFLLILMIPVVIFNWLRNGTGNLFGGSNGGLTYRSGGSSSNFGRRSSFGSSRSSFRSSSRSSSRSGGFSRSRGASGKW